MSGGFGSQRRPQQANQGTGQQYKLVTFKGEPSVAKLVTEHAEALAKHLGIRDDLTRTQLRRFYQEFVHIRQRISSGGANAYAENEVALKLLIAKAVYAGGRQNSKVPQDFIKWLKENLEQIANKEDLEKFGHYFEAFIGYFYGHGGRAKGGGN